MVVGLIILSATLGLFSAREFEAGEWTRGDGVLFVSTVLSAAGLYVLQMLRDRGQINSILDIRTKARTDLGDALDIAAEGLGELVRARGVMARGVAYGNALTLLLVAACETAGPGKGRIRASFYEHRPATAVTREGLYHVRSCGREASSFDFLAGTPIGDEALRMVKERDFLYEPDVDKAPPIHWTKGKPAVYKSFMSVSCAIKRSPIGMLTIDSTDPIDINEDDRAAMQMIGRLICVAHRLSRK